MNTKSPEWSLNKNSGSSRGINKASYCFLKVSLLNLHGTHKYIQWHRQSKFQVIFSFVSFNCIDWFALLLINKWYLTKNKRCTWLFRIGLDCHSVLFFKELYFQLKKKLSLFLLENNTRNNSMTFVSMIISLVSFDFELSPVITVIAFLSALIAADYIFFSPSKSTHLITCRLIFLYGVSVFLSKC